MDILYRINKRRLLGLCSNMTGRIVDIVIRKIFNATKSDKKIYKR